MNAQVDFNIRPFVFDKFEYTRDGDPVEQWVKTQANFLWLTYGYDFDYCEKWVREQMQKGGAAEFFDRKVKFIHQTSLGNREEKVASFYEYQNIAREEDYVLSPSQTAYKNPVKNPTLLPKFTDRNAKLRSVYKKMAQDAKVMGDKRTASSGKVMQQKKKEINNSFSGANSSWFNPLCNASGHQALTSTCRSATSYANITCEKFLAGNRVYVNADIVIQELHNAMLLADKENIYRVVKQHKLKIPTHKDVFECAAKSFKKYFKSKKLENEIKLLISVMDEPSRCAFVYLGDLYHLDKLNPEFVDGFFGEIFELSERNESDCDEYYLKASDDIKSLVFSLLKDLVKGKLYKDAEPELKNIINNTVKTYLEFMQFKEDFINVMWRPNYLPSGMAYLRTMLREVILTSDTDSAIMTMQYWSKRITGSHNFSNKSYMVAFNLIYFTSECVANAFGKLCSNMGVPAELIDQLGAKNEYGFPVYCISESMKHYFAEKEIEEGRVLPEPELEKKGVGYISARHAARIEKELDEYFVKDIIGNVKEKIFLSVDDVLARPIKLEKEIRNIIRNGEIIYQTDNIKDFNSYKRLESDATYKQYLLWRDVFGQTYGYCDEPPYSAYKVPVSLTKPRFITQWLEDIEDRTIAGRLERFFEEHDIKQISSILVPMQIAEISGIPKEIVQIVDEKRATAQIMGPFYLALGGLGLFQKNNRQTRLMTDHYFSARIPHQKSESSYQDQEQPESLDHIEG